MNIIDFDFSLVNAKVWIIVEGKQKGEKLTIQCDLLKDKQSMTKFEISVFNCNIEEGENLSVNDKAFQYYGITRCFKALINEARKNHFKIIC